MDKKTRTVLNRMWAGRSYKKGGERISVLREKQDKKSTDTINEMEDSMNLSEFLEKNASFYENLLKAFEEWWKSKVQSDPNNFSDSLSQEDWEEQYLFFASEFISGKEYK